MQMGEENEEQEEEEEEDVIDVDADIVVASSDSPGKRSAVFLGVV